MAQVRECAAQLTRLAKQVGITVILVGHVTKEVAGEGGPGGGVLLAVGELANVVEPGGGFDRLGVGPGQLGQPQGQRDDRRHVLPAVVEGDVGRAVAAAEFGQGGGVHGGAGGVAPEWSRCIRHESNLPVGI